MRRLLGSLVEAELARARLRARALARKTALLAVAALLALMALAMLTLAAFIALADAYGPALGALLTAALLAVFAAALALLAGPLSRTAPRATAARPLVDPDAADLEAALLARRLRAEADDQLRRAAPGASLAALAAGVAIGASPRLRRLLRDLLG
jgi:hypothetical protein